MGGMVESMGGFLGLSDGPKAPQMGGNKALGIMNARNDIMYNPQATAAMEGYGNGSMSLSDALNTYVGSQEGRQALADQLATGSLSGSRFATDQIQNNPILGQLFGKDGALGRANAEEQKLASQGFKLQPEDVEAYGQTSGNIARMFGQQESDLAQSLANRGLGAGPSGAAGAMFTGIQGNKNEQLAKAQMQIADQRMQNTLNRLNSTRQFMSQLGSQGADAIQQQYGRQLAGSQNVNDQLQKASQQQIAQNTGQFNAELAGKEYEAANKPKNVMDFWTAGTGQGLQSGTADATQFWTSMGGKGGGMMGGGGGGGGMGMMGG